MSQHFSPTASTLQFETQPEPLVPRPPLAAPEAPAERFDAFDPSEAAALAAIPLNATGAQGPYTTDAVKGLTYAGLRWTMSEGHAHAPQVITYSFTQTLPPDGLNWADSIKTGSFKPLSAEQQQMVRHALDLVSASVGVTFVEASQGVMKIAMGEFLQSSPSLVHAAALAYLSSDHPQEADSELSDILLNRAFFDDASLAPGTFGFEAVLHEIGHALGLKHPFSNCTGSDFILDPSLDNSAHTVMTYNFDGAHFATDLGTLDKVALQAIYGPARSAGDGGPSTTWDAAGQVLATTGSGHDDAIVGSNLGDLIIGGGGHDYLSGRDGNDTITGGSGPDVIFGGAGDDVISGKGGGDTIDGGDGFDLVDYSSASSAIVFQGKNYSGSPYGMDGAVSQVSGLANVSGIAAITAYGNGVASTSGASDNITGMNALRGSQFDDAFHIGYGPLSIDGGAGTDTVFVNKAASATFFHVNADGHLAIDGSTFENIEHFHFTDGITVAASDLLSAIANKKVSWLQSVTDLGVHDIADGGTPATPATPVAPATPATPATPLAAHNPLDDIAAAKYLALWCGLSWNGNANVPQAPTGSPLLLTYSFMTAVPDYYNARLYQDSPAAEHISGFQAFNAAQQDAARHVFDIIAQATGLSFVEVPDSAGGEIRLGMQDMAYPKAGYAYMPYIESGVPNNDPMSLDNLDQEGVMGDVFLSKRYLGDSTLAPGGDGFVVLMHEIGHALGLRHPDGLTALDNNRDFTVMAEDYGSGPMPVGYGPYDLAALRHIYGTDQQEQQVNAGITRSLDPASNVMSIGSSASNNVVIGTDLVDVITGSAGNNALYGREGNDRIDGGAGDDTVDGGLGNDLLFGGSGNDHLQGGWGADTLVGGPGIDTLDGGQGSNVLIGTGDGDTLMGCDGAPANVPETVDYSAASGPVRVELNLAYATNPDALNHDGTRGQSYLSGSGHVAGLATTDTLVNINRVVGSAFDDYITDNNLSFSWFDETLIGGAGNDTLVSHGFGNRDYSTHDVLIGGSGDDTYVLWTQGAELIEAPNEGHDTIVFGVGGGSFTLVLNNIEDVIGQDWNKLDITGNDADNRFISGSDEDVLRGGGGNDYLDAGFGKDVLTGGSGDDTLIGNGGADTMTGGGGADRFVYNYMLLDKGRDVITDFNAAEGDRIVLAQTYLSAQVAGNADGGALINLSDGNSIVLVGIDAAQVDAGWFVRG